MNRSTLALATAVMALVVAIALPISKIFRPQGHTLHEVLNSHWALSHLIGELAYGTYAVFLLAIAMLFAREIGSIAFPAALLAVAGAMLCFGDQYYAFFMQPTYAREYPETFKIFEPSSPLFQGANGLVLPVRDLMTVFGSGVLAITLGLYTPIARWAAAAFGVGTFVTFYGVQLNVTTSRVGVIIMSAGLCGIAWSLLQQRYLLDDDVASSGGGSWLDEPGIEPPSPALHGAD